MRDATGCFSLCLSYHPPLAWSELLSYLARRAVPGVEVVLDRVAYVRSVILDGNQGWVQVERDSTRHCLKASLPECMASLAPVVLGRLRNLFDIDANPCVIDAHLKIDPFLRRRVRALPGLRVPGAWDAFELGLRAILGQQVSVGGATTLSGRLAERFGDRIHTPWDGIRYLSPTAVTLAATDVGAIAEIGVPKARAATIRGLATFAALGGFQFSVGDNLDNVVEKLKQVRGVGDWTAQYIAMRALRFPDAFPAADLGLRKAVSRDHPVSAGEMLRRAEGWRPWRAYAAAHLWQSPG